MSLRLSRQRKKRAAPPTLAKPENIKEYKVVASHPVHKAAPAGIFCVDIHSNQELLLTGGNDKTAVIFNRVSSKKIATLSGHTKKVRLSLNHFKCNQCRSQAAYFTLHKS